LKYTPILPVQFVVVDVVTVVGAAAMAAMITLTMAFATGRRLIDHDFIRPAASMSHTALVEINLDGVDPASAMAAGTTHVIVAISEDEQIVACVAMRARRAFVIV
jgi:hypothetical protein